MAIIIKMPTQNERKVLDDCGLDHSLENVQMIQAAKEAADNSYAALLAEVAQEFQGKISEEELQLFSEIMIYMSKNASFENCEQYVAEKYQELWERGMFENYFLFSSRVNDAFLHGITQRCKNLDTDAALKNKRKKYYVKA